MHTEDRYNHDGTSGGTICNHFQNPGHRCDAARCTGRDEEPLVATPMLAQLAHAKKPLPKHGALLLSISLSLSLSLSLPLSLSLSIYPIPYAS